jgi:acetyl esterase/lipase
MDRSCALLRSLPALAAIVVSLAPAWCQDTGAAAREPRRVVYDTAPTRGGEMELRMDLYLPDGRPVQGAVVLVHGGSFVTGSLDLAENRAYGEALSGRGYLTAAISYRLCGDAPVVGGWARAYARRVRELRDPRLERMIERCGPEYADAVAAAAEDLLAAVAWLRGHAAELGFEPRDIALFGASAGAVTSLSAAYALDEYGGPEPDVACVLSLRGLLLRPEDGDNPIASTDPPLLIFHGEDDRRIPLAEAELVAGLAQDAALPAELHTVPGFGHDLGGEALLALRLDRGGTAADRIDAFLARCFAADGGARGRPSRLDSGPPLP